MRPWLKTKTKLKTKSAVGDSSDLAMEVPRLRATGQGMCDAKAMGLKIV